MSWLGLRTRYENRFDPAGLEMAGAQTCPAPDSLLPRGSLLIEADLTPTDRPRNLLRYAALDPWPAGLRVLQEHDGTLRLLLRQGQRHLSVSLLTDLGDVPETVHISYSWDAPARTGRFCAHAPDRGAFWKAELHGPFPMALRDARRISTSAERCPLDDGVQFVAVASHLSPAGPMPGIGKGAMVETGTTPCPIERLAAGDSVMTADGSLAEVLWAGAVTLPAAGRFAPLVMRRPYHGLQSDLVLAPDQRLCLAGTEVEYLFGEEQVSTALRHLSDRHSVSPLPRRKPLHRWYQVLLDRHAAICVNGARVESFDAAALLYQPGLLVGTVLENLPADRRPAGHGLALPVINGYEALTLTGSSFG